MSNKTSADKAIKLGYKKIDDPNAYNGCYYIKNGKKWIFNISALKRRLDITKDSDLANHGYDVEAYWEQINPPMSTYEEIFTMMHDCTIGNGEDIYLSDGLWLSDLAA